MAETAQTRMPETQLFHDVFNASPIGIAVENLEGQPLFVNSAFCSFLGFSGEELRNKHCVDFSPREDAEKDWALFQQLRAGVIDHYQLDKRYFRRDGSLVWGSLSISLLKSSPSPLVLAMVEDITDKKKAEEARYRHAAVIESSDDAIASGTLDGIIVSWNTGAQKIYGYTEAEAVGKPISMLVPPELPDEENKILETLKSGDRIEHFETVRVTKTGKRINVSLTISPIKDSTGRTVGISGIARDITERKQAEEALRASEERLRLAQQAARIGTFDWNIRSGVNTWTPELEAMYGLTPGGFGGTQTAFENLVHPDDRAGVIKLVDAAMKSGQPTKGEWRVVWADGSVHWIAGRWQVFMDASGEPSKMIGVNIDVTERKQTEEGLRNSEERFRLAAQAGKMYAYEWDVATDVIVRSGDVPGVLGSTGEASLTRQQLLAGIHPDDRPSLNASVSERTPENPETQIIYRVLRPDESIVWLEKTGRAYFDEYGRMVRMIGMVADITERKRAEEALRESETRFRLVADTAPVMIWMSGLDKKPTHFNQLWLDFTGLSETDLRNGLAGITHPEDYPKSHDIYCRAFDQRQPFRKECRLRRHDGQYRWMLDNGVPRFHKDSFAGYIGSCIDVTDHKLAEEALAEMSRKLLEAQEKERARIGRELHDDINQRLAMLAVELEQLQDNPSEVRSRVQELRQQTAELSNDVQALSHELHSSKLEYLGAIGGMKSWCKEFSERQGLQIEFKSPESQMSLPREVGLCLFRVLQEALHNAAKHSGVKRIEVQLHEETDEIHLTIRDLGKGFDVEAAKKGWGLGLTSMQERVRLVNGTIEIQSKPMGGTTIHARVPPSSENASQRAAG